MRIIQYIEIDIDRCTRTYGSAPCTAAVGVTGDRKCFNSIRTCQDRLNAVFVPVTQRFAFDTQALPVDIEAIPNLTSVSFNPGTVSLGQDLGVRGTITATFRDHPYNDIGPLGDEYRNDRAYDPAKQGSFWGKFRARFPYLRGRPMRYIVGQPGQSLAEMETRHYLIDSFEGPRPDGTFQIVAKDPLKFADNERAQAPELSEGFLVAAIAAGDGSCTLSPAGVGDAFYPASGYVAIGGEEICAFTRSGDVLTLTRAQYNTAAVDHDEQSRVQLCKSYVGQSPADIIYDLLVNYADVPAGYIPLSAWQGECNVFLQRLYTTLLAEPTGVNKLLSELIEQAALAIWWDDIAQQIRLKVIQPIPVNAVTFDENVIMNGTFGHREQPEKRLTQVWVYYAQRNPLLPLDQLNNYQSANLLNDTQAASDNGSAGIKKVFSRWIPPFGRAVATRLADLLMNRYTDAPRMFTFSLLRGGSPPIGLGDGARIGGWTLQDDTGARANAPIQVVRVVPGPAVYQIQAEEMLATTAIVDDLSVRTIIVDANTRNFNLRAAHDALYPAITDAHGITIQCVIEAGVVVGSAGNWLPAFDTGSWPVPDLDIQIVNHGYISGAGGPGGSGDGGSGVLPGGTGGTAVYCRYPVSLANYGGIGGGGGGGGAIRGGLFDAVYGGGGGAGDVPGWGGVLSGRPGAEGSTGALLSGGAGGAGSTPGTGGGAGGAPGTSGAVGSGLPTIGAPGAGGVAIDGIAYITYSGAGPVYGPTV